MTCRRGSEEGELRALIVRSGGVLGEEAEGSRGWTQTGNEAYSKDVKGKTGWHCCD